MNKLCKSDLVVLERASEILTSMYNSVDGEEKLDFFSNILWLNGIIMIQEQMKKNGCE